MMIVMTLVTIQPMIVHGVMEPENAPCYRALSGITVDLITTLARDVEELADGEISLFLTFPKKIFDNAADLVDFAAVETEDDSLVGPYRAGTVTQVTTSSSDGFHNPLDKG